MNKQFINTSYGDLPIILSSPHGGDRITFEKDGHLIRPVSRPDTAPANYPYDYSLFPDSKTNNLSQRIVERIGRLSGGRRPYQIRTLFNRRLVDVNRPVEYALPHQPGVDTKLNRAMYNSYHKTLQQMIRSVKNKFRGKPIIIIDLHSHFRDSPKSSQTTGQKLSTILVGTQDGSTLNKISQEQLRRAFLGPLKETLNHRLPQMGLPGARIKETLSKGYIEKLYSQPPYQADVIQIEFGDLLNLTDQIRRAVASAMAEALYDFSQSLEAEHYRDDDRDDHRKDYRQDQRHDQKRTYDQDHRQDYHKQQKDYRKDYQPKRTF